MSKLKQQLIIDMKIAMKAKNTDTLRSVRAIIENVKKFEIDKKIEVEDKDVVLIMQKMIKQRQDSIKQFSSAGRNDLVNKEQIELDIISKYVPEQLENKKIESIINNVIDVTGATTMADMSKVMGMLKIKLQGRADMSLVSKILKSKLS